MKHALITGGAGFIGSHLVDQLLHEGTWHVTVLDNYDPYYPRHIKEQNLTQHHANPNLTLIEGDIRDPQDLEPCHHTPIDVIVHLAAKAGVRPSLQDPLGYQDTNIRGTHTLLEAARTWGTPQFIYASSSSVYGTNPNTPWNEDDCVLKPISPYAATKVAGELLGHTYAHLYGIRFIALRYFTVYGPRQRPDLAIHKFARLILDGKPIPIYGDGTSSRDYTYITDIIQGTRAAIDYTNTNYEIINLGNDRTITLGQMITSIELALNRGATRTQRPIQAGDVLHTRAGLAKARALLDYRPRIMFEQGIIPFADWLREAT